MRCPRCFYEVPVDAEQCPKCKLATPKVQQAGVSTGLAGKYAAPQVKAKTAAGKTAKLARGKTGALAQAEAKPGLPLPQWQIIALVSGVLLISALLGYGVGEYRFWHTPAPTEQLGALQLVERAPASGGGNIGQAITTYLTSLVEEKKVDQVEGWQVKCQGKKCQVTYTIKLVNQKEPRVAVWEVDLENQKISPQNGWAIDLTK
ncbi:hypothetical protein J8C02_10190 [Chloracidobacterium sp. MS 40/45]|jgi:hypothetical protein|uniref:hypothetical protein n=1 Tax=Chloracidobacterium aggregatum TaxID=2851959 RepID=UPI001B8C8155|nr:hypothetical protein [Chloracidobacterium aggregatum]QUV99769.1 hypothetical protein J8C02_10190 [Chloracidobacterium sp. MS 40/45]